jgi:hypothetical protein
VRPAPTLQAHVPLFHFILQSTTINHYEVQGAIIILVIRLSRYYDGRWFTIQDMRALLVGGRIKKELTDKHVMFAIRSRNDARMVDNRYGRKSTRYC